MYFFTTPCGMKRYIRGMNCINGHEQLRNQGMAIKAIKESVNFSLQLRQSRNHESLNNQGIKGSRKTIKEWGMRGMTGRKEGKSSERKKQLKQPLYFGYYA